MEVAWMHYNVAYCQQAAEYWNTTWSKVTPHGSHYALRVRLKPLAAVTFVPQVCMEPGSVFGRERESRMCQHGCKPWKLQWKH